MLPGRRRRRGVPRSHGSCARGGRSTAAGDGSRSYEARNGVVDATARRLRLLEILWTVDNGDSEGANHARIARNVRHGLGNGAIVLMHENRGQTIRALKFEILPALGRRHLRLVTVPQLLARDPPTKAQLQRGLDGCRHSVGPSTRTG